MEENNSKLVSFNFKLKSAYGFLLPFLFIALRYCRDNVYHLNKPEESLKILRYNLPYLFYLFLPKLFSFILF